MSPHKQAGDIFLSGLTDTFKWAPRHLFAPALTFDTLNLSITDSPFPLPAAMPVSLLQCLMPCNRAGSAERRLSCSAFRFCSKQGSASLGQAPCTAHAALRAEAVCFLNLSVFSLFRKSYIKQNIPCLFLHLQGVFNRNLTGKICL